MPPQWRGAEANWRKVAMPRWRRPRRPGRPNSPPSPSWASHTRGSMPRTAIASALHVPGRLCLLHRGVARVSASSLRRGGVRAVGLSCGHIGMCLDQSSPPGLQHPRVGLAELCRPLRAHQAAQACCRRPRGRKMGIQADQDAATLKPTLDCTWAPTVPRPNTFTGTSMLTQKLSLHCHRAQQRQRTTLPGRGAPRSAPRGRPPVG